MKNDAKKFRVGAKIQWKWLGRQIDGTVNEVYLESVTKTIKGKSIKRNGSTENPAYLVQSSAGNLALKLHSELQSAQSKTKTPTMFGK